MQGTTHGVKAQQRHARFIVSLKRKSCSSPKGCRGLCAQRLFTHQAAKWRKCLQGGTWQSQSLELWPCRLMRKDGIRAIIVPDEGPPLNRAGQVTKKYSWPEEFA